MITDNVIVYAQDTSGVGVIEYNASDLIVFPNPATGTFHVLIANDYGQVTSLHIYDAIGKEAGRYEVKAENRIDVDAAEMDPGVYFIVLSEGSRMAGTERIVIIKE